MPLDEKISGEVFKQVLARHGYTGKMIAEKLELNQRTVYEWFSKTVVNPIKVNEVMKVTGIAREMFYPPAETKAAEDEGSYGYVHHGRNIEKALKKYGKTIQRLAKELDVSRKTLYQWLEEKEWPHDRLMQAAKALKIKVAELKGKGATENNLEKDLYDELYSIRLMLAEIHEHIIKR